jgi:hypothetical protein
MFEMAGRDFSFLARLFKSAPAFGRSMPTAPLTRFVKLGRGDIESLFCVDHLEPRTLIAASIPRRSSSASSPVHPA